MHVLRCYSLFLIAFFQLSGNAVRAQSAVCQDNPGHTVTTCRIDNPVVTQRAFQYRGVRFRPGDAVTVDAGGCVNVGASAGGWRRFVDPTGRDADRLYHGLIRMPGHPPGGGLVRIQTLVGRPLTIPTPLPPGNSFLSLGYEDSDYRDNGYTNHNDGVGGQCRLDRDGGPAWVALTIRHGGNAASADRAPLDLVAEEQDANGALLNPRFFWETRQGDHPNTSLLCDGFPYRSRADEPGMVLGNPPCTTDVATVDVASGFNAVLCRATGAPDRLHGHLNLLPATITGRVTWAGHSDWVQRGDDDYSFHLYPAHGGMLTSAHPSAIDVEFDADETIDRFGSGWWQAFQDAVDKSGGSATEDNGVSRMVDDHEAVVTGLAGIAAEHEASSQLHPVYAMALRISNEGSDDRWAFFARNWGNEGFCSSDQHYWDQSPLSLFIPGPRGATDFKLVDQDVRANRDLAIRANFMNGGVLFSFDLGAPESRSLADGSVRIRWTVAPATSGATLAANGAASTFGLPIRTRLIAQQPIGGDAENLTLTAGLPAERIAQIRRQLIRPPAPRNARSVQIAVGSATSPTPRFSRPNIRAVPDSAKLDRENRRANAVCAAQRASSPSLTAACAEARR